MKSFPALALVALFALAAPLLAQDASLEEANAAGREISARIRDAESSGNVLTVMEALRALEPEYASKGEVARQMLGLLEMERAAELGNVADALRYADLGAEPAAEAPEQVLAKVAALKPVDAIEAIADLAEDEVVVMINEAHHVPQHRAFTLRLLVRLRAMGFTHFAAETLYASDAELEERGYPTKASGAYLDEPVYADLVRTAIALGYRIVPYEAAGQRDRELGQARNLIERALEDDEDARLVVHCGYSHLNERGTLAGSMAMGARFEELTGIDPLTIDQTVMSEHSDPRFESPIYRRVVDGLHLTAPTVLFDEAGAPPWSASPGVRDVTVFSPRTVYAHGRPTWLLFGGRRKAYELPADVCGDAPRCVVEARATSEGADAIPLDRVEVVAGEPLPVLLLPPGAFTLEARSAANTRTWSATVTIR